MPNTSFAMLAKKPEPAPGEAGTMMRSAVGALFYAARGTRMDLIKGIHELARRVTRWTPECRTFLEGLLSYAKGQQIGLVLDARGTSKNLEDWKIDISTDARFHAPYSTTGLYVALSPVDERIERFLSIDWTSHAQKYVSRNSR